MFDSEVSDFGTLTSLDFLITHTDLIIVSMLREHVQVNVVCVSHKQVLKVVNKIFEAWPIVRVDAPTVFDNIEKLSVAVRGLLEAASIADELHDLGGRLAGVRCGAWNKRRSEEIL